MKIFERNAAVLLPLSTISVVATLVTGYTTGGAPKSLALSSAFVTSSRPADHSGHPGLSLHGRQGTILMYEPPHDKSGNTPTDQVWSALSNTERWISETLSASSPGGSNIGNPYARKEVSYVCETSDEVASVVSGVFRRLREARELGDAHGNAEEKRLNDRGPEYMPGTLRQTHVVVIPSNEELSGSFSVFDTLIQRINVARRNARDYVTDVGLEKLDETMMGESEERDWSVSVNCAHLHPKYGEQTAKEKLAEMKKEEEEGEVDLNLEAYKVRRLQARRSPYPTIVIEVRASPPPDFGGQNAPAAPITAAPSDEEPKVSQTDIQKLEALFGQSAATEHPTNVEEEPSSLSEEDLLWDQLGKSTSIKELSFLSPLKLAQKWVSENDPFFDINTSSFTSSSTQHVDEAYEFVFTNIAMQLSTLVKPLRADGTRQYLVMPQFLSASATSFEKFSGEVTNILDAIPSFADRLKIVTLHPEHIEADKRSPVPIFVLHWTENQEDSPPSTE